MEGKEISIDFLEIVITNHYIKEHLFDIEEEQGIPENEKPLYVLYPDESGSNWRIQAVPVSPDSFESRKALPQAWCGIRDEALSQLSGIPGCIFVHASGFIGGAYSFIMRRISALIDKSILCYRKCDKRRDDGYGRSSSAAGMIGRDKAISIIQ